MNKSKKAALLLSYLMATTILSGCINDELAPKEQLDSLEYDSQNRKGFQELTQVLDVPGEDFKLVAVYSSDPEGQRSWRITSNKFLYMKVCTQGLRNEKKVYIDNVHIDTSLISKFAITDGIMQDTMDDRIHNSLMYGFPISDDTYYYGVNAIEGMNETFIKASNFAYNGYYSSSYEEKRLTEKKYEEMGVEANKFQIVYDLLVQDGNETPRNISVASDFKKYIDYSIDEPKKLTK